MGPQKSVLDMFSQMLLLYIFLNFLMIKMLQYKMYPAGELRCPTTALVVHVPNSIFNRYIHVSLFVHVPNNICNTCIHQCVLVPTCVTEDDFRLSSVSVSVCPSKNICILL